MKHFWTISTLILLISWTVAVGMVTYGIGYEHARQDENALQTKALVKIKEVLEERCR